MVDKIRKFNVGFTQIPNVVLCDNRISLKAKGVYSYLFSKPDDWQFHIDVMEKELLESACQIRSAIKELLSFGYIVRKQFNENGRFGGMIYEFANPHRMQEIPYAEKTAYGSAPTRNNTDYTTNKEREEEKCKKENSALPPSRPDLAAYYNSFVSWWNDKLRKKQYELNATGRIKRIAVNSPQRQRAFGQRWKETKSFLIQQGQNPTDDQIFEYMTKKVIGFNYINSPFLRGDTPTSNEHPDPFEFTVDFVLRPATWTKLLENKYIDKNLDTDD